MSERTSLLKSSAEPKPVYVVPRTNSISRVTVENVKASPHYGRSQFPSSTGFLERLWPFAYQDTTRYGKIRKAPVKVEPKVFFANERTFLAWLNMSVTLASISVAILAFADHNEFSQIYGFTVLPVAVAFVIYALTTYTRRSFMLRNRMPGPYEDRVGPVVLTLLLCLSITVNFILKLIDILGDKEAAAPATPLSMKGGLGSGIKSGPVVNPAPLTGP
ncbi:hypothetical protein NSK_007422 [Nannochloropsis salina CCMP1776]|uniref:DUF202 domain-containing protein n=1 Tax=Nannochloropsis salina CCMP1776 TaxID=1027361 RepID=A0A4D9CR34_9STRA|nr:hypothetical protein NSK_007422 [Nannochloropsis salina CCMP1776]|eukprot:TFJ81246.1 hypothetical protein NSK_007422 [Nannochloropsis salina CCMP1776]